MVYFLLCAILVLQVINFLDNSDYRAQRLRDNRENENRWTLLHNYLTERDK